MMDQPSILELVTAVRERLRLIVIVFNDASLSLIEIKQEQRKLAPAGVAIAWALRNPAVTGAIVGVRSEEQLSGIATAAEIRLSDDDALAIEQRLAQKAA